MGFGGCLLHNLPWYNKEIVLSGEIPELEILQSQASTTSVGDTKVDRRSVRCSIYHLQKTFDNEVMLSNKMPDHWEVAEKKSGEVTALQKLGRTVKIRKSVPAMERPIDDIALVEKPLETLHLLATTALPDKNVPTKVKKLSFHEMQNSDVLKLLVPSPWIDW